MSLSSEIMAWVDEAIELRHGTAGDPAGPLRGSPEETMAEVVQLLQRVRMRSDRVDELLTKTALAKSRIKRASDDAKFSAETAIYTATQQRSARKGEFTSGREIEADAKLDSFEARRQAHQLALLVDQATTAYDVINNINWQLANIRNDLRARLHALQFEASL